MKKGILGGVLFLLIAGAVGAYLTLFTVNETQQALVLQFGEPKRVIKKPGLHFKIPFLQNVDFFDKRILELDAPAQEAIAADRKRLVVNAFLRYRIEDPLKFFQTVLDERRARQRLSTILESSLRRVLGESTFTAIVRDDRGKLMSHITNLVDAEAKNFGIVIIDVRLKRADLPEANSLAIYRRMQTERQREAAEIRAQGEEQARRIRADADRQVTVLQANATRDAEKLRGEGDAERNNVFADAFTRDADFFGFYRSMQAYETGLQGKDTRMLMSPNTEFFRYFNDPTGKGTVQNDPSSEGTVQKVQ